MTVPFLSYPFIATGSSTGRYLPDRLRDVINVKDWGATGNGVTDDSTAIQAAIEYARTYGTIRGATVFAPPGIYKIVTPLVIESNTGGLRFVGAGRNATILKGTSLTYILATSLATDNSHVLYLADMTIENDNTTLEGTAGAGPFSCAFFSGRSTAVNMAIERINFVGMVGCELADLNNFGIAMRDCIATQPVAIPRADSVSRIPVGVGFYFLEGEISNCLAVGFGTGFVVGTPGGVSMLSCVASRCETGFMMGERDHYPGTGTDTQIASVCNAYSIRGCIMDRCYNGIYAVNCAAGLVVGNSITGTTGFNTPAPCTLSWSGGIVTVTCPAAHNLPPSTTIKLALVTSPAGWTPDLTGEQIVTCTTTADTTHFTYTLPVNPLSFSSATWNYPMQYGMYTRTTALTLFAANNFAATATASFDTSDATSGYDRNVCMSMRGPSGWPTPVGSSTAGSCAANFQFISCGMPGHTPPTPFMTYSLLPAIGTLALDGQEFSIVDGQWSGDPGNPPFGTVMFGSGVHRVKVRFNSTNWICTGR